MNLNEGHCESVFMSSTSGNVFMYIGLLFAALITFKILRSLWRAIYTCVLGDLLGFTVNWRKLGSWAVITGSTDGIGKSYAKALAAKGFNIVLVSRTPEKLKNVAKELESKYNVQTRTVAIDVTSNSPTLYEDVRAALKELEIGVLVNNVGMSYKYTEYLTKIENGEEFADNLVKANIRSVNKMTQIVLPAMERRGKGVIINISSLSALSPVPLLSLYSACKVYVSFFTRATQEEYKNKGIIVQSVLPGFVSTTMSRMRPSLMVCTPDAFVKWALKTVGVEEQTYGYPVHKLQGYAQELLTYYLPEKLNLAINYKMMSGIRKRYYKKFGLVDESNSFKQR